MRRLVTIAITLALAVAAHATTITGKVKNAAGQGFNGSGYFELDMVGVDTAQGISLTTDPVYVKFVNGSVYAYPSMTTLSLSGNDVIQPAKTVYYLTKLDSYGNMLDRQAYYISGTSFDLGVAVPTTYTPNNISYLSPAGLNVANTFQFPITLPGLPTSPNHAATKQYVDNSAEGESVLDHGAVGDCTTNDTVAFQNAWNVSHSLYIPDPPAGACYKVDGVQITASGTIRFESRNTVVQPYTNLTQYIFNITGASIASPVSYVYFVGNGGMLYAGVTMGTNTAGIRMVYGNHVSFDHLVVNGFWNNFYIDNSFYVDLDMVKSNGSTNSCLWMQHSNSPSNPYFGGPLTVRGGTCDSNSGPYGVHVTDVAVAEFHQYDVVGETGGRGMFFSSAGVGSPLDYQSQVVLDNVVADTTASEAVYIQNTVKSVITNSWFSGGRTNTVPCVSVQNSVDMTIANNHFFWCGSDGLLIGTNSKNISITGNSSSGSPQVGFHMSSVTQSMVAANTCNSNTFNGNGVAQNWCIYEEAAASNNWYTGNDRAGTTFGNTFGTSAQYWDPGNAGTGMIKVPGATIGSTGLAFAAGGNALTKYAKYTATLSPALVAANTCTAQNLTVTGVATGDLVLRVLKPTEQAGLSVTGGRVVSANTVAIQFCNNTAAGITPTASESYTVIIVQ